MLRFIRPAFRFCVEQKLILDEVQAKVYQVLKSAAKCKVEKLNEKATFQELGFDSLDAVEMVVALEENFGFDIKNEEAERIRAVNDAVAVFYKYVLERQQIQSTQK